MDKKDLIPKKLSNFLLTTAYRDGIREVEIELTLGNDSFIVPVFPYYTSLDRALHDFVRRKQLPVQALHYAGRKDQPRDGKTVRRFVFELLLGL